MPEPEATGCEGDGGEEVSGELVVARGDATEVLELVEEALDEIALSIEGAVDRALPLAVALGRDVCSRAVIGDQLQDGFGVVATVGDGVGSGLQALEQSRDRRLVGGLAWRDQQPDWQAAGIDDGVQLGAQSSTRTADGVIWAPFFPPAAC